MSRRLATSSTRAYTANAAMTFEEISLRTGASLTAVTTMYGKAIRKLRRQGVTLAVMRTLAIELERNRREVVD